MLTKKQYELLLYIHKHLNENGVSPSFDEMKDALGLRSKSGIHRLISGLEERGFINRLAHRARALEVVRLPENQAVNGGRPSPPPPRRPAASSPTSFAAISATTWPASPAPRRSKPCPCRSTVALPRACRSRRCATSRRPSTCPPLLGRGEHFALEVAGDLMIEAGIFDGDTVIVQRMENADNGQIVVALIDESEVTLKRLRRRGASIALEPANKAYETRIFGPDRVRIQGKLVGLIRKF